MEVDKMASKNTEFLNPVTIDRFSDTVETIRDTPNLLVGLALLTPMILMAVLAPILAPYDPTTTHAADAYAGPSSQYLLGTDHYGRDLFSRVIIGGRATITLGIGSALLAVAIGIPIGLTAGFAGGNIDELLMRGIDIFISIPTILFALLIVAALSSNLTNLILAIGFIYAPRIARVTRSSTLHVREKDYVLAAKARGESSTYIMFREILPNVLPATLVEASVRAGYAIIIGTSLSFLGMGTQPPLADWGYMIGSSREHIDQTIWFLLWPSIALAITILGFHLTGDGLRDALNTNHDGDH